MYLPFFPQFVNEKFLLINSPYQKSSESSKIVVRSSLKKFNEEKKTLFNDSNLYTDWGFWFNSQNSSDIWIQKKKKKNEMRRRGSCDKHAPMYHSVKSWSRIKSKILKHLFIFWKLLLLLIIIFKFKFYKFLHIHHFRPSHQGSSCWYFSQTLWNSSSIFFFFCMTCPVFVIFLITID